MRTLARVKRKAAKRLQKKEPLIVFATWREAEASIEQLQATPLIKEELYTFPGGHLLITGMGTLAAATKIITYSHLSDEIWNIGVAGSFHSHPLQSIFPIHTISKWMAKWHPDLHTKQSGLRLLTTDLPIHDATLRDSLRDSYDLVDMEGYGCAFAAQMTGKPLLVWKCISDFAEDAAVLHAHLHACSQHIAAFLAERI